MDEIWGEVTEREESRIFGLITGTENQIFIYLCIYLFFKYLFKFGMLSLVCRHQCRDGCSGYLQFRKESGLDM